MLEIKPETWREAIIFTEKNSISFKGFKIHCKRYCEPVAIEEK
jgi:hypothetical protein